ncbi:MAG: putative iron-regulated protein [Paracoccaceae bacterium]
MDNLPRAQITLLGEIHDNAGHHLGQARALRAIAPRAVVFEMLTPEQAARVTPDLLNDQIALEQALDWNASGWPDFAIYYPVFAALDTATGYDGVKIYGAALARQDVRAAFSKGAAQVFGAQAARFGLTTALPAPEQAQREAAQFANHCEAMPLDLMGGMVAAQRLRDAALARAALMALADTGGPVVVILGNGHARSDWGVPAVLSVAAPQVSVLSVGQLEGAVAEDEPFDLWLKTPVAPRGDPCAAFN